MVWINVFTNGSKMVLFRLFWGYTWMMSFVEEKANPMNQPSNGLKIVSLLGLGRMPKKPPSHIAVWKSLRSLMVVCFFARKRFALGIEEVVLTQERER